jgi:hypothetical protein
LTIGSEPLSPNHGDGETGLPGELGPAMPGDRFSIDFPLPNSNIEQMTLIAKQPGAAPGTWIYTLWRDVNHMFQHGYSITGPNPNLYTVCGANQIPGNQNSAYVWYWNFLADPHGMNTTGLTIPPDPAASGGHGFWSHGNGGFDGAGFGETRCAAGVFGCYTTRLLNNRTFEKVLTELPTTAVMIFSPQFAHGSHDGSNHQSHPGGGGTAAPAERFNFMFDGRPYYGGASSGSANGQGSNPAVSLGGQLYKFPASSMPNIDLPYRKTNPTTAFSGQFPLVDVSGPNCSIGNTPADSYKYGVVAAPGECYPGSAIGDVYVNAPHVRYPFCFNAEQNANLTDEYDICIAGSPMIRDAIMQVDMTKPDNEGKSQRVLTKFNRARVESVFYAPYVFPNGQWLMFESQFPGDGSVNKAYLLAKIPPPVPQDNYNRLDFIPISVTLPPLTGATQAFVRFGYAENGSYANLFCTSRKESCVVGANASIASINPVNPFFLETVEAGRWSGMACTNGCTINVPGVPQRVLYYQFVYQNSTGGVVYTSPVSTTIVP